MKTAPIIALKAFFGIILIYAYEANAQGAWTKKADFAEIRYFAIGFSIGTKGYIGTGGFGVSYKKDFWAWDQATNTWTQKADFGGTARYGAVGFSIGAKGYIGTGYDGAYKQDFWEWDQANNLWVQKNNFGGIARRKAVGFSISTKGYIGTGFDGASPHNDFWEWDSSTDAWTQKADFGGISRENAVGFSIGNKGYIGGGNDSSYLLYNDFWEWDQTTNIWTQKANFGTTGKRNAIGFSIGTQGYIGTGFNTNSATKDFWAWDQSTNTWSKQTDLGGGARAEAVSFSIGNKGYIGTGDNGVSIHYQDFWEWTPTGNPNSIDQSYNQINFKIAPNPSAGLFNISLPENLTEYFITDVLGNKIFSPSNKNEKSIDLSFAPQGIYFIHIKTSHSVSIEKIIKK
jgi:hypothetical protein